ncbi:MAG: tRNA (adenosine(37)-N6)-threonylcarbamoyltransferase complex dimerization subunit type 1 TsaB [Gemmatimonadaceae bacterium]|nr:tRNA (adenosine(37)-N6)-threonylcarbamoyltransferase complex dimerization subunit type 1 TsaB [Gemmatimonadaceae bacterium]
MTTMPVLVFDASTSVATAACLDGERLLARGDVMLKDRWREPLLPLLVDVLARADVRWDALTALVVGEGPGSFTSLRIAAATAKGLAHASSLRLESVSSLVLIAAADDAPVGTRRLATLDALRGEVYAQLVERAAGGWHALGAPLVLAAAAVPAWAAARGADVVDGQRQRAEASALRAVSPMERRVVDLAKWEPSYGRLAEAQVQWEATHGTPLPRTSAALG